MQLDYRLQYRKFLTSQYLAMGARVTAGAVIPSIVLYHFGLLASYVAIPLGALVVSFTDNPGPPHHRRNRRIKQRQRRAQLMPQHRNHQPRMQLGHQHRLHRLRQHGIEQELRHPSRGARLPWLLGLPRGRQFFSRHTPQRTTVPAVPG